MTIVMKERATPYKLASARYKRGERTVVEVDGRKLGGDHFATIAGPCAVESREVMLESARIVRDLEAVAEVADVIQLGARSMQNYPLLTEVGRAGKPVLVKRGLSATLEELLLAAEYLLKE